ncbi:hypothetical protein PDE_05958 [Penicillium oxalicum 114-2]|uniref:Aminoglycoside phosphotransferase domain-containing protein n=1 Tax=Penicillium oxalicum (strain 114-2 / CGMCC 5302) TaxID=933388 RepID=S7ZL07_PENO1|nr:hypothetical protein PDE_05958 [Penicillium oxalicum 114-2]
MALNHPDQPHITESIREISDNSWLISSEFLLAHYPSPPPAENISADHTCWSDSNGGHFMLSPAPEPLPDSRPLSEYSPHLPRVYAIGNSTAVWRAGEAFIKVHTIYSPLLTREHVTLRFLKDRQPQGFTFPEVYRHFEVDNRYFMIVSKVPGQLLDEAWPSMDETLREYYIGKMANICHYLARWKGDTISGVDGNSLQEWYLRKGNDDSADAVTPEQLTKNCTAMEMDVSNLVFYHCDLGPTNLLVDPSTSALGIIDWEIAGYVPIEWVRTKFRLSPGIDFTYTDDASKTDWRRRVAQRLEKMGYRDVVDAFFKFQKS